MHACEVGSAIIAGIYGSGCHEEREIEEKRESEREKEREGG
jgi:hypothetical protein